MIANRQTHTHTHTLITILRAPYGWRSNYTITRHFSIGADFHRAMVATAPGEKQTPHGAPPCQQLDPSTMTISDAYGNAVRYQINLFCAANYICS